MEAEMRYAEWRQLPSHWIEKTPGGQLRYVTAHVEDERMLPLPIDPPKAQRPPEVIVVQESRSSQGGKAQSRGRHDWVSQLLGVAVMMTFAVLGVAVFRSVLGFVLDSAQTSAADPAGYLLETLIKVVPVLFAVGVGVIVITASFGESISDWFE
jgi:hypothetical protein